jgi:hypothetical protein
MIAVDAAAKAVVVRTENRGLLRCTLAIDGNVDEEIVAFEFPALCQRIVDCLQSIALSRIGGVEVRIGSVYSSGEATDLVRPARRNGRPVVVHAFDLECQ